MSGTGQNAKNSQVSITSREREGAANQRWRRAAGLSRESPAVLFNDDRRGSLLSRDVVGADHVAPELELALKQRARHFRRLLVGRKQIHAAFFERLANLGVCERVAQRGIH